MLRVALGAPVVWLVHTGGCRGVVVGAVVPRRGEVGDFMGFGVRDGAAMREANSPRRTSPRHAQVTPERALELNRKYKGDDGGGRVADPHHVTASRQLHFALKLVSSDVRGQVDCGFACGGGARTRPRLRNSKGIYVKNPAVVAAARSAGVAYKNAVKTAKRVVTKINEGMWQSSAPAPGARVAGSGRPNVLPPEWQDAASKQAKKWRGFFSVKDMHEFLQRELQQTFSVSTLARAMNNAGWNKRRVLVKPHVSAKQKQDRIDFSRSTLDQVEKLGGWTSANCTRPQDKVAWIDVDEKWFVTLCVKGRMWHIDADDFNFAPRMVARLEKAFARKKREKTKGIHAPVSEEWLIPDIVVTTQPAQSPDTNICDLAFFSASQTAVQKRRREQGHAFDVDKLEDDVEKVFNQYPNEKLRAMWDTKAKVLQKIVHAEGGYNYNLHGPVMTAHRKGALTWDFPTYGK